MFQILVGVGDKLLGINSRHAGGVVIGDRFYNALQDVICKQYPCLNKYQVIVGLSSDGDDDNIETIIYEGSLVDRMYIDSLATKEEMIEFVENAVHDLIANPRLWR